MSGSSDNHIRLNKYLAQRGIASRRGADDLVAQGKVKINGRVVEKPGVKVDPAKDLVEVAGKAVSGESNRQLTIILHKPTMVVTTASDPQGRKTVMDMLPDSVRKLRPFPVGRLDFMSEGLLLLTTEGELCHRLTHPKWHQPKVYEVTVRNKFSPKALNSMRSGMTLAEGEKLAPIRVRILDDSRSDRQVIEMKLIQGINRQIRRMCRDLEMTILKLKRIRQGNVCLGGLKSGNWREISAKELAELKASVDLS